MSILNPVEAKLAVDIVQRLLRAGSVDMDGIGVITPYQAQTNLIQEKLVEKSLASVEVANIDAFQGREHDVIVLSLVRSNSRGELGVVDDCRRLNVSLTRAKRALVVIGDSDTLAHGKEVLSSFMRDVYERGAVIEVPPDQQRPVDFISGDPE